MFAVTAASVGEVEAGTEITAVAESESEGGIPLPLEGAATAAEDEIRETGEIAGVGMTAGAAGAAEEVAEEGVGVGVVRVGVGVVAVTGM